MNSPEEEKQSEISEEKTEETTKKKKTRVIDFTKKRGKKPKQSNAPFWGR